MVTGRTEDAERLKDGRQRVGGRWRDGPILGSLQLLQAPDAEASGEVQDHGPFPSPYEQQVPLSQQHLLVVFSIKAVREGFRSLPQLRAGPDGLEGWMDRQILGRANLPSPQETLDHAVGRG